jgi:hypothetical protein
MRYSRLEGVEYVLANDMIDRAEAARHGRSEQAFAITTAMK